MVAVARHFRNYLSAGLISCLVGLISFPLLTRSLSVEEYGWLGLIASTLTVFVSFGKLGLQSAILRFFSEARAVGEAALRSLLDNVTGVCLLLAGICLSLWLLYSSLVVPQLTDGEMMKGIFYIAAALVPIKILFSISTSILKADERSGFLSSMTVAEKVLKLTLILIILYVFGATAELVMASTVLVEAIVLLYVLYQCRSYFAGTQPTVSYKALSPLVAFGVPLMAGETIAVLLEVGDRYVIQAYLGGEALGQYSAAVNISMYLEWVLILALQSAIVPYYVRLYEEQGRAATLVFMNSALEIYTAVALGVFAVFSATAPSLILILAGDRYTPGLVVIPWFAAALVMLGSVSIAASGVYIDKRPGALVKWVAVAFVLNVTLNLLTVPIWGLVAAAVVTFLSMSVQCLGVYWEAYKTMPVKPPISVAVSGLFAALTALFTSRSIDTGNLFADLVATGTCSTAVYLALLLATSARIRALLFDQVSTFFASR